MYDDVVDVNPNEWRWKEEKRTSSTVENVLDFEICCIVVINSKWKRTKQSENIDFL